MDLEIFISERTKPYSGIEKWSVCNILCDKCGKITKAWHTGVMDYGCDDDYAEYMCADCLSTGWYRI